MRRPPDDIFLLMITHENAWFPDLHMYARPSGGLFTAKITNENVKSRSFVRTPARPATSPRSFKLKRIRKFHSSRVSGELCRFASKTAIF